MTLLALAALAAGNPTGLAGFIAAIPEGWWIAIGTFISGLILKGYDKWLKRDETKATMSKNYRDEIKELQERLDHVEDEVTTWRNKFYAEQAKVATLETAMIKAGIPVPKP